MHASHHYSRRILVCVTGLTPQVVTETVYALAHRPDPWIPTEVHVITTLTGAQRARLLLLAPDRDQFGQLCREYDLRDTVFDEAHIHVVTDADAEPLDDIRSQADNLAVADAILAKIADFSADPECAIHVSLAGGRKSMGFFAGYALSLYGRAQDQLSHVLVSPQFETNPEFFFPPKAPRVLLTRSGEPVSTADAQVHLADIPFVRLRDCLPTDLLPGGRFVDAVAAAQRLEATPKLRVILAQRTLECAGVDIALTPMLFAVYAWHVQRCLAHEGATVPLTDFNAVGSVLRRDLFEFGCTLYPNPMTVEGSQWRERPWQDDAADHGQWLSERRTRINAAIGRTLGKPGERIYGIKSRVITHRRSQHLVDLPAQYIEVVT